MACYGSNLLDDGKSPKQRVLPNVIHRNIDVVQQDTQSGIYWASLIQHFLQLCNGWTCRVVRVVPHTKVCEYSLYKTLLMMDRWGPKHVELTYVMNKNSLIKNHIVYLVGLHIYTRWYTVPTISSDTSSSETYRTVFIAQSNSKLGIWLCTHFFCEYIIFIFRD